MSFRKPSTASAFYYPLDQTLEVPRVRVLRALQRFDSATSDDITIALDDLHSGRLIGDVLRSLAKDGCARASAGSYRITARGRQELRKMLGRAELCA